MSDDTKRKATPTDDDICVQRVEMNFYVPVYISQEQQRWLHDVMDGIVRSAVNQFEGHAHWVSSYGAKPNFSKADAMFLGVRADANAPDTGEPEFDDSVFELSTYCRPLHPSERAEADPDGRLPHEEKD